MVERARKLMTPFMAFVRGESLGGVLLVLTALIAFAWANSPWAAAYEHLKDVDLGLAFGAWHLEMHLLHWVNDGLMAVFFLLVGLEIKREVLVGELSNRRAAALPVAAAVGGMVVPAALYVLLAGGGAAASGWGVPMATDIAFALGVMTLLGDRVPLSLKVFLTALAIVDDLGAIAVIALFYTEGVALDMLGLAGLAWGAALLYAALGGRRLSVYALVGIVMWYFTLQSGIHATVAGVLLALAVPMSHRIDAAALQERLRALAASGDFERQVVIAERLEDMVEQSQSPLHRLEHMLHPVIAFGVMPVFALFNAGFALSGGASLGDPAALGSFVGLLIGKPVGVLVASGLAVAAGVAALPRGVSWVSVAGAGVLAGIGFTMALFIAGLAFPDPAMLDQAKLGVMSASVLAALLGVVLLVAGSRERG